VLLAQSKKIDRLQTQIKDLQGQLEEKELKISRAGSIAEASVSLSRVFEEAQKAADQYLENVKLLHDQTEKECADKKKRADRQIQHSLIKAKKAVREMLSLYSAEVGKRVRKLHEWDVQMEALRERKDERISAKPEN
jgi:hypothetical protein